MLKTVLSNWIIPAIILIVLLFAMYFFGAGWAGLLVVLLFCLSLAWTVFTILQEQGKLYRGKRISRSQVVRNALFQIAGVLLAMALASVLGRWLAEAATQQISNGLIRFIAGMVVGLLAGMGVGYLVKQMWGRLSDSNA